LLAAALLLVFGDLGAEIICQSVDRIELELFDFGALAWFRREVGGGLFKSFEMRSRDGVLRVVGDHAQDPVAPHSTTVWVDDRTRVRTY
jgi:hypothetical protein